MSAGSANEAAQVLNFVVSTTNTAMFSVPPAIAANGTLTYTPAPTANGSATVTVQVHDDGGTANGGVDTSAAQTFTISVNAVNNAPSFTKGANQTVNEDAGGQTVVGWATAISAGPANEAAQVLNFIVSNTNTALFSVPPAIAANIGRAHTSTPDTSASRTPTSPLHNNSGT